jgi:Domain of unknown function (DUF1844)
MGKDEEAESTRGFKVADRRRFVNPEAAEGDKREPDVESPSGDERDAGEGGGRPRAADAQDSSADAEEGAGALAEMTFTTFVMGLTTQALMHLGEIADPEQHHPQRDLPAAKQMIDLLGILSEKTKGNLDAAEEQLLGAMLYDLRMRYVEVARSD